MRSSKRARVPQGDLFHVLAWGFAPLYAGLLGVYRVRAKLWKVFASQCNEAEVCKTHDVDVLRPTKSCNANDLAVQIGKYVTRSLQSSGVKAWTASSRSSMAWPMGIDLGTRKTPGMETPARTRL